MHEHKLAKAGYLTAAIMRYKEQDYKAVRELISRVYDRAYEKGLEDGRKAAEAVEDADDKIIKEANAYVIEQRSKPQPPSMMTIIKGAWNYKILNKD